MGHSAERRHHLDRMKRKARRIYPHDEFATWANHLAGCSCPMCRNPRTSRLTKGSERLTVQERRFENLPSSE